VKPNNLKAVIRDLTQLIEEEKETIDITEEKIHKEFLERNDFQLELSEKEAHLRKTVDNYSVHLSIELPNDDMDSDVGQNPEGEEEEKGEGEEGEENAQYDDRLERSISLDVIIESKKGNQKMIAECAIAKDRNFYIENVRFGENERRLWFTDLSDSLQGSIFDWFENLGLNSETSNFILDYVSDYRSKSALSTLNKMQEFIAVNTAPKKK